MDKSVRDVTGENSFVIDHAQVDGNEVYPVDDVISDYDILDISQSPVVSKFSFSLNDRLTSATSTALKSTSVVTLVIVASLTCIVGVIYVVMYIRRLGLVGSSSTSSSLMRSKYVVLHRGGSRRGGYRQTQSQYVQHHSTDEKADVLYQRYERPVSTKIIIYASPMTTT